MFNYVKECKRLFHFVGFLVENNKKLLNNQKRLRFLFNGSSQARLFSVFQSRGLLVTDYNHQLILSRNKSKGKEKRHRYSAEEESSDEDEDFDDDEEDVFDKDAEIKMYSVNSLRTDLILKTVLGISRKKIEENFYENKIRINGNLLFKKSQSVEDGDEIDIIKKIEDHCENTINVGRVKIIKSKFDADTNKYIIKAWKAKSLVIENYDGVNSWKENEGTS